MAVLKSVTSNGAAPVHPGLALDVILKERGISQSELARQTGVAFQRVNGMVRGRRAITVDSALRLQQVLGVSAADLLRAQNEYDLYHRQLKIAKPLKGLRPLLRGRDRARAG